MSFWSRKFVEPVTLKRGDPLRTLSDARALILSLPDRHAERSYWHFACELLLHAAKTGRKADVEEARQQLCRAAKSDALL